MEKLSTACVQDLWMAEEIIPKAATEAMDSRLKPPLTPLSGGNGSPQRVDQVKRVTEG
ncbi:hypothetical protein [Streptomyces himalayensis]|uniref:Uncharacterized protein n=1 Tax=Streptomyces himalayensis subsp. himalayensis TaxID=2756131 RepID=A0A7W0DI26_9ACTN|nr:hypothetical protein [Streptomyces himalayensis]MBA2945442.1 hypothetical protein [Streptomyces himalayensis subsp. himalayensis]